MSPSSACKEDEASEVTSRRRDVANTLNLNGQVTPHASHTTSVFLEHFMRMEKRTCGVSLPLVLQFFGRLFQRHGRRLFKGSKQRTITLVEFVRPHMAIHDFEL